MKTHSLNKSTFRIESRPIHTYNLHFRIVKYRRLWYKMLRSLIRKPTPVVFIEWKHNIDFHREIYTKNDAYRPKTNILP